MSSTLAPQVRILGGEETIVLPDLLACAAGFTGLEPWLHFVHKTYGFPIYRIVSEMGTVVDGWLALVRVKHPVFGDSLVTSPFGSYGGFGYSFPASTRALPAMAPAMGIVPGVE